jgi:GrpB-like predicted nucleotidyltransferase (UPF0157 family)
VRHPVNPEIFIMELVTLVPESELRPRIAQAFALREAQLSCWLPFAEIEHVGSTAIPGALTKGDLDVLVRVAAGDFRVAEEVLAGLFARNEGTPRTEALASFKDDAANPPLGIQLVVRGTEWDVVFGRFRDALIRDRRLVVEYNRLKERFQCQSMDEYRNSKDQFIARVLAGASV